MAYEIRELSVAEVLNQAIDVLARNFLTLAIILGVLVIPLGIAMSMVDPVTTVVTPEGTRVEPLKPEQAMIYGVLVLLYSLGAVVSNAAIVYAIADAYLGNTPNVGKSIGKAFKRVGPLIWTWILVSAAILGGLILFIIPGIIAILWFSLATQVVVLEPRSGFDAMKRSKELMKGNIIKYIGLILLLLVLGFMLGLAVGTIGTLAGNDVVFKISNVLSNAVQTLIGSAVGVVFYFSARCKHENFDLELLANSLAESVDETPYATDNP